MNPAKKQPTVPAFRDWAESQTVKCCQLSEIITEAAKAGYEAFSMDINPVGYRLMFHKALKPLTVDHPTQPELTLIEKSTI
jgi:hypothetical protein